ncbi:STAS domain-containing protein [Streptomyces sp. NPDC059072]|uniref:STAS domain-containing protein n=1 Tax=unclassified Streptomyces TaxID=2593676 RepID=UPI0036B0B284
MAVRTHPKRTVVTLAGTIDTDTCPSLTKVTDTLPLDGRPLALDLTAVTFMASCGLNAFLALRNRAEAHGNRLELICVPRPVLRMLDLTGTRRLFALTPCPTP